MKLCLTVNAALANAVVAAMTYFYYGVNAVGLTVGARNTARFSGVAFAMALVARSAHNEKYRSAYVPLVLAFLSAHYLHVATVIALHWLSMPNGLHLLFVKNIAAPIGGMILVTMAAISAGGWPKTNAVFIYLVWAAFMLGFSSSIEKRPFVEGPFVAMMIAAMGLHLYQRFTKPRASVASA
jgi:hypothetical protein